MPYADPARQREACRVNTRRYRERKKLKMGFHKHICKCCGKVSWCNSIKCTELNGDLEKVVAAKPLGGQ